MLWLNKNIKQYQTEYEISKRKFTNLMNNKYFIFEKLIEDADIVYTEKNGISQRKKKFKRNRL